MNILLLGSGGREHALAWKLAQSRICDKLYAAPGNPGIAEEAELVSLDIIVRSTDASEGATGETYWIAARWARATVAVLVRYPRLDVPAPLSYGHMAHGIRIGATDRPRDEEDRPVDLGSIVIPVDVHSIRVVRTS